MSARMIDTATRHMQLAARLGRGEVITSAMIRAEYGVSVATSKRDLVALEFALKANTTRGGLNRCEKALSA